MMSDATPLMIGHTKLYKKSSTGATLVWYIEQNEHRYRSVHGQLDGQLITDEYTVCKGKNIGRSNESSPGQQASSEVESKYKKQQAQGGYFLSIKDIGQKLFFAPMLSKQWEDRKDEIDWSKGVYVSPKMDGLRCVITEDGASSRNGKSFVSFRHILRELEPVFKKFPGLILDGEVYTNKLKTDFNKIISLAKKTKPTEEDFIESERWLEYHVFDCPYFEGGYHERYTELQDFFNKHFRDNKWIKLCPHSLIKEEAKIEEFLQRYIEAGYEGLMANTYDGVYEQKRSKNILKHKLFQDCEAEIVDIIAGQGNRSGMFGYAELKLDNGITFDSNARGDEKLYTKILNEKKKYIGKRATVRYQNLTPDGKPRFPVIIDFDRFDA